MRLLQRPQRYWHILVTEMRAAIAQAIAGQPRADAVEGIDEDSARFIMLDLMIFELERRDSTADADFEPSIAEMIEHTDFFDQAQR